MSEQTFTGDPLIEIARAIGRIEALVGAAISKGNDHEARITTLEQFRLKIIVLAGVVSAGVGALQWAIPLWIK